MASNAEGTGVLATAIQQVITKVGMANKLKNPNSTLLVVWYNTGITTLHFSFFTTK
jgi:hypothetical protein